MIDIRDHGGMFGGTKYRKGYRFKPTELGLLFVPIEEIYSYSTDYRIDAVVIDDEDESLWVAGYSTASGARYCFKLVYDASFSYMRYKNVLSISGLDASGYPTNLLIVPGQPYVYFNDKHFKKFNKHTGQLVKSFNRHLNIVTLSRDGQYIYGYDESILTLYILNLDLEVVAQIVTVPKWNSDYAFVGNRYFIMHNYNTLEGGGSPYKTVCYDMETMQLIWKPGQNQNEGVSNGASFPFTAYTDDTYIWSVRNQHIHRYRLSDMYRDMSVRVVTGAYETLRGIMNFDEDRFAVFYQNGNSSPMVLRLLRKSELLIFEDYPYNLKFDYNAYVFRYSEKRGYFYYSLGEGTWKVKRVRDSLILQ
jgi:hypothetical protein